MFASCWFSVTPPPRPPPPCKMFVSQSFDFLIWNLSTLIGGIVTLLVTALFYKHALNKIYVYIWQKRIRQFEGIFHTGILLFNVPVSSDLLDMQDINRCAFQVFHIFLNDIQYVFF